MCVVFVSLVFFLLGRNRQRFSSFSSRRCRLPRFGQFSYTPGYLCFPRFGTPSDLGSCVFDVFFVSFASCVKIDCMLFVCFFCELCLCLCFFSVRVVERGLV